MSDPKPIASLSSALLARKGEASPAMRRQGSAGLSGFNISPEPQSEANADDLGWNDMGHDVAHHTNHAGLSPMAPSADIVQAFPAAEVTEEVDFVPEVSTPEVPVVVQQQRELVEEYQPQPVATPVVQAKANVLQRAAPGARGKAAFTLRLDSDRHLKLRVVCALRHRSAQYIVTEALDAFLAKQSLPADLASPSNSASGGD